MTPARNDTDTMSCQLRLPFLTPWKPDTAFACLTTHIHQLLFWSLGTKPKINQSSVHSNSFIDRLKFLQRYFSMLHCKSLDLIGMLTLNTSPPPSLQYLNQSCSFTDILDCSNIYLVSNGTHNTDRTLISPQLWSPYLHPQCWGSS